VEAYFCLDFSLVRFFLSRKRNEQARTVELAQATAKHSKCSKTERWQSKCIAN